MKSSYILLILVVVIIVIIFACGKNNKENYYLRDLPYDEANGGYPAPSRGVRGMYGGYDSAPGYDAGMGLTW